MEYSKYLPKEEYEKHDIRTALLTRLEVLYQQSPERFSKPIDVLPTIDDTIEDQLQLRLQMERKSHAKARIILIPYNLGNSHWIGILIEFKADEGVKRAEYIDPINGSNSIPDRIQKQFTRVYPDDSLQTRMLLKQDDFQNSAWLTIENLLIAAFKQDEGNKSELSELEHRLASGMVKYNIGDKTQLLETIQKTEEKIQRYEKLGKPKDVERKKEDLRALKELEHLLKEIDIRIGSMNHEELKCHQLKKSLMSGLGKHKIQNKALLPDVIQETEEKIQKYERQRRTREAEKKKEDLKELKDLQQLSAEIQLIEEMINRKFSENENILVDLQIQGEDLAKMPSCAEQTIMKLQEHFQRRLLSEQIPSLTRRSMLDLFDLLQNQMKKQELISPEIITKLQELSRCLHSDDCSYILHLLKDLLKKIRPINVHEIRRLVAKAEKAADLMRDKDIILLVGETGSGKSTTVQFLAGTKMRKTKVKIASEIYVDHIEPVGSKMSSELKSVISNPLNKSETRSIVPIRVLLKNHFGQYANEDIILCDAPTFDDTAGAEVDIANSIGVIEAIKGCSSVKLLTLLSYKGSGDKGQSIQKLAHVLINMINRIEDQLEAIFYAFTKYPPTVDINMLLLEIQNSKVKTNVSPSSNSAFVTVLSDMIAKTKDGAEKLDPINADPKDLIEKLTRMHGIQEPEDIFRFSISQETQTTLTNQMERYKSNIVCAMKYKDIDLVKHYLDELKTFRDLLKQDSIQDIYEKSLNFVRESIAKSYAEIMEKFNHSFASREILREKDISYYKAFIDYLNDIEKLSEHLGSEIISSKVLVHNMDLELQKRCHTLLVEDLRNPLIRTFLDNLCMLKNAFKFLESNYISCCQKFSDCFERVVKSVREPIKTNDFKDIAEVLLIISESSHALKSHLDRQMQERYWEAIKLLMEHLSHLIDEADLLLKKLHWNQSDVEKLKSFLEILGSVEENGALQDHISAYTDMLTDKTDVPGKTFQYFSEIHKKFIARVIQYFENMSARIKERLKENDDYTLENVEKMMIEIQAIHAIPELESKTAGIYFRTIESVHGYMQQLQKNTEDLIANIDNSSEKTSYRTLVRSLSRLKNAAWIDRYRPGAHHMMMRHITEELVEYARQLEVRLMKLDLGLKCPENLSVAQEIVEKMESMCILECSVPELEKYRVNLFQRFVESTQDIFDRIQKMFNLQNPTVYQIKKELNELGQIKRDYENMHPARVYLRKHESSDIDLLTREIESLRNQQKTQLINQHRQTELKNSLNNLESIKKTYDSLLTSRVSIPEEEINFLRKNGFRSFESLCATIQEKKRAIVELEQEKHSHSFTDRLDASLVNSASAYLIQCEKIPYTRIKEIATDMNELLKEYIREYGDFLNEEINRNFRTIVNPDFKGDYSQYSHDLGLRLRELSSLSKFPFIFDCIDGTEKQEHWCQIFLDYHQHLGDQMEECKLSGNRRELRLHLIIAQALTCADRFCTSKEFGALCRHYQIEVNRESKAAYRTLLEYLSKGNYASAALLLPDIPLNDRDSAQIKHELESSVHKLMKETKSSAQLLEERIELGEDDQDRIKEIKENLDKIRIVLSRRNISELLEDKMRNDLEIFAHDIDRIFTDILLRGVDAIEVFMSTDNFFEAEQGMENLSHVQRELADHCASTSVASKTKDLRKRFDQVVNEISQRDFEDISKYSTNPPKDLILKLKKAASRGNPRFKQACDIVMGKIQQSLSSTIDQVRMSAIEERANRLRPLNNVVGFLPDELQASFKLQIDELSKSLEKEEKLWKRELDEILNKVNDDDHAIMNVGLLLERYRKQNMNELFDILRQEIFKKLHNYRGNIENALDQQDMQLALNILKKIIKYKESIGSHIPEIQTEEKNACELVTKNFLNCCNTLLNISTIEQRQPVEEAFNNLNICLSFSVQFLSEHALINGTNALQHLSEYFCENSEKYRVAMKEMNSIGLRQVLIIAKRWDGLLQKIKQCSSKHQSLLKLVKDMKNAITYKEMIIQLQKEVDYLKSRIDVELISDETTRFESKREEFFSNLIKSLCTLKEMNSKLKDILPLQIDVDQLDNTLKRKIEKLGNHLLVIGSKGDISARDCDQFRMYYNHLVSLDKHVLNIGLDIQQFLNASEEKIFDQIKSCSKKIRAATSDVTRVSELLTRMKFFAENLSMFDSKINAEIDEALRIYKEKQGIQALMRLTIALEKTDIGARLISEHACLSGEDWRRRREKMQNQDNLEYVLKELSGDDIATDVLTAQFSIFRRKYDDLISHYLTAYDQNSESDLDLEALIVEAKALATKMTQKTKTTTWNRSFKEIIPELLGCIFAVWTLKHTEHYNMLRGIESAQAYLLMPHVAQVLAIFRILGVGYSKQPTKYEVHHTPSRRKISDDLVNNLVEIGTGEGKSVVMAVTACVFALTGVDVNCSCYSEVLSTRDKNDFASVFRAFGVEERIEYGTFNTLCENLLNEQCNVRETVRHMIINNKSSLDVVETMRYMRAKVLLIDEVDVFLSDKFYGGLYTPAVYLKDSYIKALLDTIWQNKSVRNLRGIKATAAYQACATRFSHWTFLFDEAIKDMIAALQSFQSSTYIVQNDKIVYVEGESVVDNVVRGYHTVWTYYHENEKGNISQNSLEINVGIIVNCGIFSYAEMPHDFAYIAGVTGTLRTLARTEKDILKYVYNVQKNTFMPSVFGKSNRLYNSNNDVHVLSESEYFMRIRGEIDAVCNANRAILVFFESEEKLMKFYQSPELSSKKNDIQIITEKVSVKERELYIKRAATMNRVTLLTRIFGRGTDFICRNQQLLLNGGIHVLQTFFSEELSEEYQIMGRGARQGDPGSYRMVLLDKDLEWILGATWKEDLPKIAGTILYRNLNKTRDACYEMKCAAKELSIEQCKRDHQESKEFMAALSSGDMDNVKNYLFKQNRGVNLSTKTSRTVLLMDATGSMSSLLSAAKETVCTMFERASTILEEKGLPSDIFQMQIAIYRNYNSNANKILQASPWETKASNLRAFLNTISSEGGWKREAIEIGLWHAVKESEMPSSIAQVILIGDAPPNTLEEVSRKRANLGENYWKQTRFTSLTYYEYEVEKLKRKNIPVHAFYLTDYAKNDFQRIASATQGRCEWLDIHSSEGAESLTDFVTEEILRHAAGDQGDEAVELYRARYVRKSYMF